jgi:hypothetical protein
MRILPALTAVALALAASAVQAKPMALNAKQMDRVTAGQTGLPFEVPNFNLNLPEGFSEALQGSVALVGSLARGALGGGDSITATSTTSAQ